MTTLSDLLDQVDVDAFMNPWNRNYWPRWLLWPQGVSGALKRRTGSGPWRELRRYGPLPLGGAVVTGAGQMSDRLPLVQVASLHAYWRASERSVRAAALNGVAAAWASGARSLAVPLLGTGEGHLSEDFVADLLEDTLNRAASPTADATMTVRIVCGTADAHRDPH